MIATQEYSPANIITTDRRVVEVPWELIDPAADNERPDSDYALDDTDFAQLVDSIRERGIREPLRGWLKPNGRIGLTSGHRRHAAAGVLELATVPMILDPAPPDDAERARDRLAANLHKRPNALLVARTLQTVLAANPALTQEEVGAAMGRSQSAVANTLRLLSLPLEVQALVESGQLAASTAHELLGVTEAPINYSGQDARTIAEEQVRLAQEAAAEGISAKQMRVRVAEIAQSNARVREYRAQQAQYTAQSTRHQSQWAEEDRLRALRRKAAQGQATDEERGQLDAAQKAAEAKAKREKDAAEREKTRLEARERTAAATIDALLGYDPVAPPNLEVLRLAVMVCARGAHISLYGRKDWQDRIAAAPDQATLLQLLAEAARLALDLDPEHRELNYSLPWDLRKWFDARWGINAALADALLAEKLVTPRSHEALVKQAVKGPYPGRAALAAGRAAPPCDACGGPTYPDGDWCRCPRCDDGAEAAAPGAPAAAAPPLIPPAPETVAAWLDRCWAEQAMPACRFCGTESPDPAAYVQPGICATCAPTLVARYRVADYPATPEAGRCAECGGGVYLAEGVEWCPQCDRGEPAPPDIIIGWLTFQADARCRSCGVGSRDPAFYAQPGICHGCGPAPAAIPTPQAAEGVDAAA